MGVIAGGCFSRRQLAFDAVDVFRGKTKRLKQVFLRQTKVAFGVIRRYGALVAPENMHP